MPDKPEIDDDTDCPFSLVAGHLPRGERKAPGGVQ